MESGTYTLVLGLNSDIRVEVGALGELKLPSGYYLYTGSAQPPTGFKRLERHMDKLKNKSGSKTWHIDYLTQHPKSVYEAAVKNPGGNECSVNQAIALEEIQGFGCSDCNCTSHLHISPRRENAVKTAVDAHKQHSESIDVDN